MPGITIRGRPGSGGRSHPALPWLNRFNAVSTCVVLFDASTAGSNFVVLVVGTEFNQWNGHGDEGVLSCEFVQLFPQP